LFIKFKGLLEYSRLASTKGKIVFAIFVDVNKKADNLEENCNVKVGKAPVEWN